MSNEEFFENNCVSGAIGIVGGSSLIDKTIKKAQKNITSNEQDSLFSHVFLISEKRIDGKWWVIESDLEIHKKQIKLGVQENRIEKYFDINAYPNVAILNFNLTPLQNEEVLKEALNVVCNRAKYSMREIFGMLYSLSNTSKRHRENKLSQDNSFVCSSFVQHCYKTIDINFNSSVSLKNITPHDIYVTEIPHLTTEIIRHKTRTA